MNTTNRASGAILVPYPKGKEFKSGHGQLGNLQIGVTAKRATNIANLAIAKLGDGLSVFKELVVVKGGDYHGGEPKDSLVEQDEVGFSVGVSSHFPGAGRCRRGQNRVNGVKIVVVIARLPQSSLRRWSGAVVEWVCINWKDTAMKAIYLR
jgi:hypothetical protein